MWDESDTGLMGKYRLLIVVFGRSFGSTLSFSFDCPTPVNQVGRRVRRNGGTRKETVVTQTSVTSLFDDSVCRNFVRETFSSGRHQCHFPPVVRLHRRTRVSGQGPLTSVASFLREDAQSFPSVYRQRKQLYTPTRVVDKSGSLTTNLTRP